MGMFVAGYPQGCKTPQTSKKVLEIRPEQWYSSKAARSRQVVLLCNGKQHV